MLSSVNLRWLKPVPLLIVLSVTIVFMVLRILSLPQVLPNFQGLQSVENLTYDWRMKGLYHRQAAVAANLGAVFIDDEGLKYLNEQYMGSPLFSAEDFPNLSGLIAKLRKSPDPLSGYIWQQLPISAQQVLSHPDSTAAQLEEALVQGFDQVIKGPLLYSSSRFAKVTLSEETAGLITKRLQGEALMQLNRRLLEEAYPQEIAKSRCQFYYPLPRQLYGKVVRELLTQGAKAVAFDILFAERHFRAAATDIRLEDGRIIGSDDFFARQIRASSNRVILAVMGQSNRDPDTGKVVWSPILPASLFTNGATLAHIVSAADEDGKTRSGFAFKEDQSTNRVERYWSLGILLAARELGLDLRPDQVERTKDALVFHGPNGLQRRLPVDKDNKFLINWSMAWNDKRMAIKPIEDVLLWDQQRQYGSTNIVPVFKDKLVVIGSLGSGNNISDVGATPVDKETYLVSKWWNVANALITNRVIKSCPLWLEFAAIAWMTILGAFLTYAARPWLSSVCVVGCIGVYISFAQWLFYEHLFWLPIITPSVAAVLSCHFATMTYRVVVEQREKRHIKGVFSKVVSPDIVNELLQAERLSLGGAQRRVTVFFADVRGFTDLTDASLARAEEHVRRYNLTGQAANDYFDEQARELLATVNLYLSTVAGIVKNHGGTLDKYIGDCVMAFWGAPTPTEKHAYTCVHAAIAVQQAISRLNREREQENQLRELENAKRAAAKLPQLPLLSQLSLGSGINTGVVTVGLMGSEEHLFNYTVFGREVNLASRLEGVSGRGRIIIGEAAYEDLQRDDPALASACIPQEPVNVKGFRKLVQVYEVPWKPPERAGAAPVKKSPPSTPGSTSAA